MFALIASLAFAAPSIQAVAAGYAEVCSTNLADADCNRLIVTGTSPDEQEMLKLDCGSTNLARCETAWTKVLTAIGNRPEGMLGFVTEPAPKPTAILVESKGGHLGPPVPPPVVGQDPRQGRGLQAQAARASSGRSAARRAECFGPAPSRRRTWRSSTTTATTEPIVRPASPPGGQRPHQRLRSRDRGDVVNR